MIKIENVVTPSSEQMEAVVRGARNPMNSWDKIDSVFDFDGYYSLGEADLKLLMKLAKAGTTDSKYRRMLTVYAEITAPLYWWKEYDTYKVGTVANSCSTMHKIHSKEFTMNDFSIEHLLAPIQDFRPIVDLLNDYRSMFLSTGDKKFWWQMIQLLPTSYNQKRTVMLNYEVLRNIYKYRRDHRLDEWRDMCRWIDGLPYAELITGGQKEDE